MPRTVEYENPGRVKLIRDLKSVAKREDAPIWRAVAEDLSQSRRRRREVNLQKINQYTKKNDVAIVPGKVLGNGFLDHKVDIAAFQFTTGAKRKIEDAGGKTLSINELVKENPKGSKIKYVG
ncbi:50S ribosomal protein L18e [Candidatus Altiarchaeota archaeon]